ncbi:MAG: hypothetical protein JWM40_1979, partial [Frankiales bacterium]|nr:hypothetical protein [Frankiales bacterium]
MLVVALLVAGCAAGDGKSARVAPTPEDSASSALVGRWELVRTCRGLVDAARAAHVPELAPQIVGDYFPNVPAATLAKKKDLCAGATPQVHSHFFTAAGTFGSLDEQRKQVDDGTYELLGAGGFRLLGSDAETFRFTVTGNASLEMEPVIPTALVERARANP